MIDVLGVNELAEVFGVTRRTISDLTRRGVIARRGRGFDRARARGAIALTCARRRLVAVERPALLLR